MTTPRRNSRPLRGLAAPTLGDRSRILLMLLEVCRNLERLQPRAVSRRACREVARRLRALLREEQGMVGGGKE